MSSQAEHNVNNKSELLSLINKYPDGIAANDLKDAYPNVMEDLQVPTTHITHVITWFLKLTRLSCVIVGTESFG